MIKRVNVETEIAEFWDQVGGRQDFHAVLAAYAGTEEELSGVRDGLAALLKAYSFLEDKEDLDSAARKELAGEKQGGFLKRLAEFSGAWCFPSELAEDLAQVAELAEGQRYSGPGAVQMMTMRKAKGLEADIVIVVGLEDDIVPNPKGDLEEEARLFYVAMTRTKKKLYLLHAFRRPRNISYGDAITRKPRSCFLDAIGRRSEWRKT